MKGDFTFEQFQRQLREGLQLMTEFKTSLVDRLNYVEEISNDAIASGCDQSQVFDFKCLMLDEYMPIQQGANHKEGGNK